MKEQKRRINLGDSAVRSRLNSGEVKDTKDIGLVWMEQKKLAKERWELEPERKSIQEHLKPVISFSKKAVLYANKMLSKAKKSKKIHSIFPFLTKSRKVTVAASVAVVFAVFVIISSNRDTNTNTTAVLSSGIETPQDGRTDEKPTFKILYPKGKQDLQAVTRKSPSGVLLHSYRDFIAEAEIEITQQELPANFKENPAAELQKIAEGFQATNIIQIDEALIYHGLDEKTGVQSLFAIKDNTFISIRSAQQLSDDSWAAYILSLE